MYSYHLNIRAYQVLIHKSRPCNTCIPEKVNRVVGVSNLHIYRSNIFKTRFGWRLMCFNLAPAYRLFIQDL